MILYQLEYRKIEKIIDKYIITYTFRFRVLGIETTDAQMVDNTIPRAAVTTHNKTFWKNTNTNAAVRITTPIIVTEICFIMENLAVSGTATRRVAVIVPHNKLLRYAALLRLNPRLSANEYSQFPKVEMYP